MAKMRIPDNPNAPDEPTVAAELDNPNAPPHLRAGADTGIVMIEPMQGVEFAYEAGSKICVPAAIASEWISAGIAKKG